MSIAAMGDSIPDDDAVTLGGDAFADVDALARAMYASYLASELIEALVLGERVVARHPEHTLAQAVVSRCRALLGEEER